MDEIKKQKKTLKPRNVYTSVHSVTGICIGLTFENVWVSNMRRSDGDNWDREQKLKWLVWLGGLSKQEVFLGDGMDGIPTIEK